MAALDEISTWGAEHAAAGVARARETAALAGDVDNVFRWASVTKLLTATAVLVAAEEGVVDLDEPAGPPGATVRHLLAHASGLPFEGAEPIARPGERRIYSNAGYEALGRLIEGKAAMPFSEYLAEAVVAPLRMASTELRGSAASECFGPLRALLAFGRECLAPTLLAPETFAEATSVAFPGLVGVVPGIGRQDPCDWGLGFELKGAKEPHWTGARNSPRTYGHFGGAGTFLWIDPDAALALGCLTNRDFDDWALQAWPALSDAVLQEYA